MFSKNVLTEEIELMNWTVFWVALAAGAALVVAYLFFSQRQAAYLSILLYQQGNADAYLKELDSFSSKFFFGKRLRTLMTIDAYLQKNDNDALETVFGEVDDKPMAAGDKLLVLQKEMSWRLGLGQMDKAADVYARIQDLKGRMKEKNRERYTDSFLEADYMNAIYLEHSGKYADDLVRKAKELKDDIPAGVYYYKAAQSYYLKKDMRKCTDALKRAQTRLKNTSYEAKINRLLKDGISDDLLDPRVS